MASYGGLFDFGAADAMAQRERAGQTAQAMQMAQMTPQQQVAFARINGAQQMGAGLGNAVRQGVGAMTGADVRTPPEKIAAVQAQVRNELRGVDPTDLDRVYAVIIRVLHEHGMVAEAQQARAEYEKIKMQRQDRTLRERDIARKEKADTDKATAAAERNRLAAEALASKDPMRLVESYGKMHDALEAAESEAEKKELQARLRALGAVLKIKPEKVGDEWQLRVVPNTKHGEGYIIKYNKVTGEVTKEPLGGRVAAAEGEAGDGSAGGPAGKMSPIKDHVTADGRQIFQDKNGKQFVMDDAGDWEPANSGARDTRDRALPDNIRKKVVINDSTIALIDNILREMADPRTKGFLGVKGYLNKFADSLDRLQASGVPVRAQITNLMSSTLHARSGAAVTVQEFDRLRGFLPQATDSWQVAFNKLRSMRQVAVAETNSLRASFENPSRDYGAPASLGAAPTAQRAVGQQPSPTVAPKAGKPTVSNW